MSNGPTCACSQCGADESLRSAKFSESDCEPPRTICFPSAANLVYALTSAVRRCNYDDAAAVLLHAIAQQVSARAACFLLADQASGRLTEDKTWCSQVAAPHGGAAGDHQPPSPSSLAEQAARTGSAVIESGPDGTCAATPIRDGDALTGVLAFTWNTPAADGPALRELLEVGGSTFGIALARARAAAALRRSELRYRTLFDAMTEGFGLFEVITAPTGQALDYRYLDINPTLERWLHMPRATTIGHTARELQPDISGTWMEMVCGVALTGQPAHCRHHSRHTGRDYDVYAFSPEHNVAAVLYIDITDQLQTQAALQKANDRLRDTLDSITDAYFALDESYRFVELNAAAERVVFGRPARELVGRSIWEVSPEAQGGEAFQEHRSSLTSNGSVHFELEAESHDHCWEIHAYRRDDRHEVYMREITERKQAEDRMRLLLELTAAFSQAVTREEVAAVIMDRAVPALDGRAGWVAGLSDGGAAAEELGTYQGGHEVRRRHGPIPLTDPSPLADAMRVRQPVWIEDVAELARRYPGLAEAHQAIGGLRAVAGLPLVLGERVIGGVAVGFTAVHAFSREERAFLVMLAGYCAQAMERATLFEAERRARLEAERANDLRLRFLAMISHELRTPLTSIKGFATTLLAEDVRWEPEQQRDFLQVIDQEADKLTDMIDQLLDLGRIESGTLRIEPQSQPLTKIIAMAQRQMVTLAQRHVLTTSLATDLPPVCADAQRVAQVLLNLVGNAVKYAPYGTVIQLGVERQDRWARVTVADQGPGIPPGDAPYVFEAFRRGSGGTSRQTKGAGLGLAICKGIVEAHGGRIWLQEHEGPGTVIAFTLPLA